MSMNPFQQENQPNDINLAIYLNSKHYIKNKERVTTAIFFFFVRQLEAKYNPNTVETQYDSKTYTKH